ncbi:MAG: ClbS/DfsB family four-helix bundle protein [Anaerolineaceae bacterium]|nr:ClbS/DfsB family four-helix bundle protein [Anaerolineaceae bacterium]
MHETLDKPKMLALLHTEYAFVERTLALVPPERMEEVGAQGANSVWTVKDTIAHLTAWERRAVRWLAEAAAGNPPTIPSGGFTDASVDALNEQTYQENKDRPVEVVLADFQRTHRDVIAGLEALPETDLFELHRLKGIWREPPFALIAGNTYEHYPEHIALVRQWLRQIEKSGQ